MQFLSSITLLEGVAWALAFQFLILIWLLINQSQQRKLSRQFNEKTLEAFTMQLHQVHLDVSEKIAQGQLMTQQLIHDTVQKQMTDVREQISHSFKQHASSLTSHLQLLTEEIRNHLHSLTQQVNHKLTEGFEKTSSTFIDVVKRLTIIDEAQKKITELSNHVVSLQDVLVDKKARGAFGEVQLATLISNMIPPNHFAMQYTLSNQKRADCILFLPEPTGNVVIDAKFPLETYQRLISTDAGSVEKNHYNSSFVRIFKNILKILQKNTSFPMKRLMVP